MPAATNVQAKKKAGSTVREHLPGLLKTRAIMQLITQTSNLTMSSREIAALTGKRHDNVVADVRKMLSELVLGTPEFLGVYEAENGQQYECFNLPKRESLILISGYSIELRARIIDRWQELESQASKPVALSRMDILTLAMESEQARIQAEAERDHAIATKAQIGSKREATAMATASAAKREAEKLRDQLGFNTRHATILAVEDITGDDYNFVPLRRWCKANEVTPQSVPDKRYPGGVKAWPAKAWLDVYGIDLGELFSVEAFA